jgi:hypothetical protein
VEKEGKNEFCNYKLAVTLIFKIAINFSKTMGSHDDCKNRMGKYMRLIISMVE